VPMPIENMRCASWREGRQCRYSVVARVAGVALCYDHLAAIKTELLSPVDLVRLEDSVRPDQPRSVVYYIGNPATQLVKIGCTTNLRRRFYSHAAEFPGLKLLATEPGSFAEETARHRHFASLRSPLGRHREWFKRAPLLMEHVTELRLKYGLLMAGGGQLWRDEIALFPGGPS
jgi:hypothetical protein